MRGSAGRRRARIRSSALVALVASAVCGAGHAGASGTERTRATVQIPRGSLTQLPEGRGCVSKGHVDGCALARGLAGAAAVAITRNGRNVYVAANNSSAVAAFTRDLRTGALAQLSGVHGCISESGNEGCTTGQGLNGAFAVAVSPDGRNVYVASYQAVAAFARDPGTGALTQLPGNAACVGEGGADGCATGRGLDSAASVTVSADGRNVYVASVRSSAVAVFTRDPMGGALHQLDGLAGCTSQFENDGCQRGRGLDGAFSIAVTPDGKDAYAATLYSNAIVSFQRDPIDGELSEVPSAAACTSEGGSEGCATGRGIEGPNGVVVAPDGAYVYAASSGSSAVAALLRNPGSGALDQLPGPYGCTSEGGVEGCATGRGLGGSYGLTITRGGDSLYVATLNSIAAFARDRATGRLLELSGPQGCVDEHHREGCAGGRGLAGAASVAVSPDGRSVYVASLESGSVAVFARTNASATVSASLSGVPRRCASGAFTVRATATSTLRLRSLRLMLDRRVIASAAGHGFRRRIHVRRLAIGRHRLRLMATDVAGHTASRKARFARCR